MFVGHIAVALIAKRARPATSLGWYVAGATALDLIWPFALLIGAEHVSLAPGAMAFTPLLFDSYPWSHSLLMAVAWGVLLAGLARWRKVNRVDATLVGFLVVSHWVLDLVTHGPDLPLWPGSSPHVGFGLWSSIAGTFTVEGILWLVAIALYLRPRRATSWVGPVAFWSLIVAATAIWVSGALSPPPPDAQTLALFALLGWVVFPWAAWADRHYVRRETHRAAV